MKFLILLSLICGLVVVSQAAVGLGDFKDPKHPGKCVIDDDLMLEPSEEASHPTKCVHYICHEDGKANIHTCGKLIPPPGFKFGDPTNPSKPYPECCEKEIVPIA